MSFHLIIDGGVMGLHTAVKAIFEIRRASATGNFVIIPEYTEIQTDLVNGDGEIYLTPNTLGSIYQCTILKEDEISIAQFFFEMPNTNVMLSTLNHYTAWPYAIDEGNGVSKFIDLEDIVEGEPNFGLNKFLTEFAPEDGERRFGFSAVTVDLVSGLTDALAGKAATNHTHQINHVDGLESALNGFEPTITATTAADYYRGDKTFQPLNKTAVGLTNVDDTSDLDKPISNLTQTALDTKEPTLAATTSADYYRGDKTFQPLNKAAVGLSNVDNTSDLAKPLSTSAITALAGKLSEVVTPSAATGEALTMVKSGTNGQMKKLIAGQDTTLSSTADTVTVGTTGRTLKDFVEVSETVNSKFYRYLVPNASAVPSSTPVHVRLVGRSSIDSDKFSLAITDAASAFEKVNTGSGSVDLQINRGAINQTASGSNNFVAGAFNRVTGDNNVVLGCGATSTFGSFVSGNGNVLLGTYSTVAGVGNLLLVSFSNVTGNNNKVFGANGTAGDSNVLLGEGGGVTGNGCTAIHAGSTFYNTRTTRGMSNVHTQSTSPSLNGFDAGQQNLEALYQFDANEVFSNVTWVTLTSDRLAVGTTNVYVLSSLAAVAFNGYVVIGSFATSIQDSYIYRLEGAYADGAVVFTKTLVKAAGVATYDIQVVVSSGKLLVQVKASAEATGVAADHARANIRFFELCGQS